MRRSTRLEEKSRLLKMLGAGNGEYELLGETRAYVAKVNLRSCECGVWHISKVPCSHALARIGHYFQHKDVIVKLVHLSLTKTAFQQTYASMIHSIPDGYVWPQITVTPVIPQPLKTLSGMPKVTRKREPDERSKGTRGSSLYAENVNFLDTTKGHARG
ncbi:hypothetical protein ACOSQ3_012838 [Xanthoceras sorbifolium]